MTESIIEKQRLRRICTSLFFGRGQIYVCTDIIRLWVHREGWKNISKDALRIRIRIRIFIYPQPLQGKIDRCTC